MNLQHKRNFVFISFDCFGTLQCIATCVNFWIFKLVSGMKPAALWRACFHTGAAPTLLPQKIGSCCVGKVRRLFGGLQWEVLVGGIG